MTMQADAQMVMRRADEIGTYSEMDGGIYRPYGSPALASVMDVVARWMRDAGMTTLRDAFGNLIGTYPAAEGSEETRPFVLGGHLDSVPDAGRYDGILGVLTAIAVVEGLHREGRRLRMPVQVLAIADEEGSRFQAIIGSRAWTGTLTAADLAVEDEHGVSLADAIRAFGGDPDNLPDVPPELLGFLETHIEQGPVLEAEDLPVGVVTSIVASERAEMWVRGVAGHAGTVPMPLRKDALAAASEIVLAIERIVTGFEGMVGTVGELDVSPGASNVIPGEARLTCEVRHPSPATCREAMRAIREEAEAICTRRDVGLAWRDANGYGATPSDERLVTLLGEAIAAEGLRVHELPSGAGHDAINVGKIAPAAMLFVRCKDGISHNPAESVREDDVEVAIRVMRGFLERV